MPSDDHADAQVAVAFSRLDACPAWDPATADSIRLGNGSVRPVDMMTRVVEMLVELEAASGSGDNGRDEG